MKKYLHAVFMRFRYGFIFTVLILLFLLIILWDKIVYKVPDGHEGVIWHSFRFPWAPNYHSELAGEGLAFIWPWDKFYLYDIRLKTHNETYQVVSQEGLHFEIEMTFRWRVVGENLVELNQTVGLDYLQSMLIPEIGSVLRHVVADYRAEALYTVARNAVQAEIYEEVTSSSLPNHIGSRATQEPGITIVLQDTLMTRIELPETLQVAIESKLAEAEMVEQYEFRVERERLESERKQIEAEGIRNFQETVAPAITDSYLQWRGIEATLQLAESDNAKVVVIGNSANGLPLILDTGDGARRPAASILDSVIEPDSDTETDPETNNETDQTGAAQQQ
ncbi:prohibitin family protein [Pseudohongiella sp.]|uniref:Band 7 domain-containing protein n=1 Tax=marine sediment metagenome TaxID=412755 RepID=A0A0F9WJT9_9ZZZZ|nr:prohibitin family protein [Pseudohongiella sp.]HDZ08118.1 prohibitin family protein [Pseudohongiella sp.]HEA63086.1 prohibitin family protein [Pseudohongiella sp.]